MELENEKKHIIRRFFPRDEDFNLLIQKGIFCYKYVDNYDKLNERRLPDAKYFYNTLEEKEVSTEDYNRALQVWDHFNIKTLGEFSDLYLMKDVLLLCSIFEAFRETLLKSHSLDPAHYFTVSSFAWDSMLYCTQIELELLSDMDQILMVEDGIRGGYVTSVNKYVVANNKYMGDDFDPSQPSKYIIYLDFNNLYAHGKFIFSFLFYLIL